MSMICSICINNVSYVCVKCDTPFCNDCFFNGSLLANVGYCASCSNDLLFAKTDDNVFDTINLPDEPFVIKKCKWCTDAMICTKCTHSDLSESTHPTDEIAEPLFRIMVLHFGLTQVNSTTTDKFNNNPSVNYNSYKKFYKNKILTNTVRSVIHMMYYYLDQCVKPDIGSEDYYWMERKNLLQRIFAERGLFWCPEYLSLYKEWLKTYVPSVKSNRYTKMTAFVDHFISCFS